MSDDPAPTPLKALHSESTLNQAKLSVFERWSNEAIKESLAPGQTHFLKTRPDGTILDGHHRIHVLKNRNEDIDALPREVLPPTAAEE
jgi:hypothetical protein